MAKSIAASIVVFLLCAVFTGALVYAVRAVNYDAEVLRIEKEIELQRLKNEKQEAVIAYHERQREAARMNRLDDSRLGAVVMGLNYAVKNLWYAIPIGLLVCSMALYAYSRKLTSQQTLALLKRQDEQEAEKSALRIVEKAIPAISRSIAASIPKQAVIQQPVIDISPAAEQPETPALRAFSGNVHFSQAQLDEDYDSDAVLMGRELETGGLCQIPLDELQSLTVNGLQKQGKSVLLLSVIHAALTQKYLNQQPVNVILIDIHAGLKDSLLTRLEAFTPGAASLFDRVFGNEDVINNELPEYLDGLIDQGKQRTGDGMTLVCFDEYTETVANLENGKDIEARVKRLFNYRKAGIYLALAMFEAGKNNQSAKGLNVSKMSVSKALFHTAKDEGARFLPGGKEAATLDKGEYLLLLPGMAEPERIKAPLFSSMDFATFAQFVKEDATAPEAVNAEPKPATDEPAVTPERVKELMTESLSKTAKASGIPKSTLSNFLNGKGQLSDVQAAALEAYLMPDASNVLDFEQRRKALLKQG